MSVFFRLSAMQKLLVTLSGLAEKAMMMRFNCQLATNVRKRAELQTCFSPAFYAKPVLNDGSLSVVFFKRNALFACHVAFCVCKNIVQLSSNCRPSKHEKLKAFLNYCQSVKRFCSVELRCRAFRSFGH